jgi:hypothetical protein
LSPIYTNVSSANSLMWHSFTVVFISFMYSRKRSGPKTEPWDTPRWFLTGPVSILSILVRCGLPVKHDSYHSFSTRLTPLLSNFFNNIFLSTVSKARFKSRNSTTIVWLLFIASLLLVITKFNAVFQEWLFLNADYVFSRMLLISKYSCSCIFTTVSYIFSYVIDWSELSNFLSTIFFLKLM